MKSSNRIPRHDWKNHTKFVTLNATFRILKVNATGNGHRGCIYFENLHAENLPAGHILLDALRYTFFP